MSRSSRANVVHALRETIRAVEEELELPQQDSDLNELKTILVRRIADLERESELSESMPALPEAAQ
jgi:hypothetical protein